MIESSLENEERRKREGVKEEGVKEEEVGEEEKRDGWKGKRVEHSSAIIQAKFACLK